MPDLTFHPPELRADPATPLQLRVGDQLKVHCLWNNPTQMNLTFGPKMGLFFAQTVDDAEMGNWGGDGGKWREF